MSIKQERRVPLAQPKPNGRGTGRLCLGKRSAPERAQRAIGGGVA